MDKPQKDIIEEEKEQDTSENNIDEFSKIKQMIKDNQKASK